MRFELDDFIIELGEIEIKKVKKFDRVFRIGFGGSIDQRPIIVDGVIYFGALDNFIYAVDAESGEEIWKFRTNGPIMESSPIIDSNILYIGCFDFNLYAINIKNGKEKWRFKAGGEVFNLNPFLIN
ncbi:MAG: PQQ-binding-like beta-propeller repeat protein, partial [Candidatus Aenigmatarchaeota archaeon]